MKTNSESQSRSHFDVIIVGAGAAGLMCAIQAGRRNRSVLLVDHGHKLGGKILISGGGRCNFTNTGASPAQYVSQNPHFAKSALTRYPSERFIEMVKDHHIQFHEKKLGQLFCDHSATEIVSLLKNECDQVNVKLELNCKVLNVSQANPPHALNQKFHLDTSNGQLSCQSLVIATGGLSIPKIGATGFGYEIAKQFGLKVLKLHPALDGFIFADQEIRSLKELSGLSLDCIITCNQSSFRENILFTHSGLSGPAALQASLHWWPGDSVFINLLPEFDSLNWILKEKKLGSRILMKNLLSERFPHRFADRFCELYFPNSLPLAQISEKTLIAFSENLHSWKITPSGTVGYNKAEVTRGGIDTDELSSKTMESKKVPGLYFIGEVVDVTGWLGGYNFQWAWASGWAAAQAV